MFSTLSCIALTVYYDSSGADSHFHQLGCRSGLSTDSCSAPDPHTILELIILYLTQREKSREMLPE